MIEDEKRNEIEDDATEDDLLSEIERTLAADDDASPVASKEAERDQVKSIKIGFQGGGILSAYSAGVVCALLEDPRVAIEGVSASGEGVLNAMALAQGLASGDRQNAIDCLIELWERLRKEFNSYQKSPERLFKEYFDFNTVYENSNLQIFVSLTNVETGRIRVFTKESLTPEILSTATIDPYVRLPHKIDGVAYFDGSFLGNPALFPLTHGGGSLDIIVILTNPMTRKVESDTQHQLLDRVKEIAFNSALTRELRAIEFLRKCVDQGALDPKQFPVPYIHFVGLKDNDRLVDATRNSTSDIPWLIDAGRAAGSQWLEENFSALGVRSTVNAAALFA